MFHVRFTLCASGSGQPWSLAARLLSLLDAEQLTAITPFQPTLMRVFALSDFIAESAIHAPALLIELLQGTEFSQQAERQQKDYAGPARMSELATVDNEDRFKQLLRRFRRRHMTVIAWRELSALCRRGKFCSSLGTGRCPYHSWRWLALPPRPAGNRAHL